MVLSPFTTCCFSSVTNAETAKGHKIHPIYTIIPPFPLGVLKKFYFSLLSFIFLKKLSV
jgi:hypothetical protein